MMSDVETMGRFNPCLGKSACRDDGARCLTCGRTLQEIERLRAALEQLTSLAIDYDYQNIDEFAAYVARKLTKSISYRQQQQETQ